MAFSVLNRKIRYRILHGFQAGFQVFLVIPSLFDERFLEPQILSNRVEAAKVDNALYDIVYPGLDSQ